jgi:DNA end-binding protein Ku
VSRAVWTGTLSFGLVTIPVRLYPATEPKDVRFHLVDERGRRVRYRRFVETEPSSPALPGSAEPASPDEDGDGDEVLVRGQIAEPAESEVEYHELMRGFETEDGVVVMRPEEIEAARPERSRSIEIEDFVRLADIDPVYFEKSYVVAPQRGAEKPYALLLRAIERSGRVGIGRFVLRTKPHLVAIRPREGVLGLETLFFGDEVRDGRMLVGGIEGIDVSQRELSLAETLIDTLGRDWNPAAYADTYREDLLGRIAAKAPAEREPESGFGPPSRRAEELMESLKASVEAAKAKRSKAKPRASRKRPA